MAEQHWDDPHRIAQRTEALAALDARSGRSALTARAALAKDIGDSERQSGREAHGSLPSNFLPPDLRHSETLTGTQNAEAHREALARLPDPTAARRATAQQARDIATVTQLAGTSKVGPAVQWSHSDYLKVVKRNPADGRLRIDWERVGETGD